MRATITQEFQEYYKVDGAIPRMTWQELWDECVEEKLPFDVSPNVGMKTMNVRLTDKKTGEKTGSWLICGTFVDQYADVDQDAVCYGLLKHIMEIDYFGRLKRRKKTKTVPVVEEKKKEEVKIEIKKINPAVEIIQLRKKRDNLSVRLNDWKKKGRDCTALEKELEEIREKIKGMK